MANTDLDAVRLSISATLDEIERGHKALGLGPDPEDREAYDIVCRIERKLLARLAAPPTPTPTSQPEKDHP